MNEPQETYSIDACDEAFVEDFLPYKGSPDPHVVWRAAWQSAMRRVAPPAVLVEPAKGDRVRTADGYEGTVTVISPPNKRFHVHIHKGQGDVYHANELTVLAAPAVPLEQKPQEP